VTGLDRITIVAEPSRFSGPVPPHRPASSREINGFDEFARELATRSGRPVDILEDRLVAAPPTGIILLDASADLERVFGESDPGMAATLPGRIVLMNADRSDVLKLLERHRLAGAIPQQRYFDWLKYRQREAGGGIYGLKTVGQAMGAACATSSVFQSEHYCLLGGGRVDVPDLPAFLARYLEQYGSNRT
jgi:hypothetical protein